MQLHPEVEAGDYFPEIAQQAPIESEFSPDTVSVRCLPELRTKVAHRADVRVERRWKRARRQRFEAFLIGQHAGHRGRLELVDAAANAGVLGSNWPCDWASLNEASIMSAAPNLLDRLKAALNMRAKTWPQLLARNGWFATEQHHMGRMAMASVAENLRLKMEKRSSLTDDEAFAPFTSLVQFSLNVGLPQLASRYWPTLDKIIAASEQNLKAARSDPAARFHKGSPYYNIGLCHFVGGDLERGFQFLAMTGDEHANGGGDPFPVVLGDHVLSKQFLIAPLVAEFVPGWSTGYQEITNRVLNEAELVALIKRAAKRPTDGIQLLLSLHRLLKSRGSIQNDWTRYLRTRALAELLVSLESMLRRIQAGHSGELQSQFEKMFSGKTPYNGPFLAFHLAFKAAYKPPGGVDSTRTPAAVNWSVNEALTRIAAAGTREEKAGVACYAAVRLRNTLLHVLETNLDIYTDEAKCMDMFSVCLAAFGIAADGEDGVL